MTHSRPGILALVRPIGRRLPFAALLWSAPLLAQQATEPAAPATGSAPKINLAVPDAHQPVQRTHRLHEGFYLRVNAGLGWVGSEFAPKGGPDVSASGSDLALDLLVGAAPTPGVTLGGAVFSHLVLAHKLDPSDADVGSSDMKLFLIGPFIDGFPRTKGGFDVGASVGVASLSLGDIDTLGVGATGWLGYTAWVGDEWSIGSVGRYLLARTSGDGGEFDDVNATSHTLTLALSVLYN